MPTLALSEPEGVWVWCWRVPDTWTSSQALNPAERERAAILVSPRQRHWYAAGLVFRRHVLGRLLALPPEQVLFTVNAHGKPSLHSSQNPHDWRFNLSHSADVLILAAVRGHEIGVDIERTRSEVEWAGVAQIVFSPPEREVLAQAADPLSTFYSLWTAKEAYLKACGVGLSAPLTDISLSVQADQIEVAQPLPGEVREFHGWALCPLTDCRAAVMVERRFSAVRPPLHLEVLSHLPP